MAPKALMPPERPAPPAPPAATALSIPAPAARFAPCSENAMEEAMHSTGALVCSLHWGPLSVTAYRLLVSQAKPKVFSHELPLLPVRLTCLTPVLITPAGLPL